MTRTPTATPMLLALVLALGSTGAMAQDRDRHDGPERHGPPPREMRHDDRGHDERGAGPDHDFRRGGRLPAQYRDHQYVVDDWRAHHLSAPPRGYHWVQTGPDYVLAAIATGVIAQVLLGN
jgi:Ni/Co efflux regulator RcnB